MSKHSLIIGGSTCARVLNCPGSNRLIASLPDVVDTPSVHATTGTALHELIAELIQDPDLQPPDFLGRTVEVPGEGSILITQELIHDCLLPALQFYEDEIDAALGDTDPILVEQRVKFPGIPDAFGTCDLIAFDSRSGTTTVVDFKFGAGVPVSAVYPDPDDPEYETVNAQLQYYACAARHSLPHLFAADGAIRLFIVQPRARDEAERVTMASVSHADLDAFEQAVVAAVAAAAGPRAPMKEGPWCRFAVCKTTCPLKLRPLLSPELLAAAALPPEPKAPLHHEVLSTILDAAHLLEPIFEEARRQAHEILENGGDVPGYKIVAKRATRQWLKSESALIRAFQRMGLKKKDLFVSKFVSPAQAEKLLPPGAELPKASCGAISSGTTLAHANDARPELPNVTSAMKKVLASLPTSP